MTTTLQFPSQATITMPAGVQVQQPHPAIFAFSIDDDALSLVFAEANADLAVAMQAAYQQLHPGDGRKPLQSLTPPDANWERSQVDIYAEDEAGRTTMILGRGAGTLSWVLSFRASKAVGEKRSAQVMTIFSSLKAPAMKAIDFTGVAPQALSANIAELEAFIREAMARAKVPGLAIAVVEDGKVAYSQGFGVARLAEKEGRKEVPVDLATRFMVGSTTKPLTTFMVSRLAETGVLTWQDKVVDLDPRFRLKDHELTQRLTLADLASASTGIARRDLPMMLNHTDKGPDDALRELVYLEQTTGERETFQYNNQLFAALGFIAARHARPKQDAGEAYHSLMQELVFSPLGMHDTTANCAAGFAAPQAAASYRCGLEGQQQRIDSQLERFADYVAPAGGVWSTVEDMAKFALTELNYGRKAEGKSVASEASIRERRAKQVALSEEAHYGLGWLVGKSSGLEVVQHGGATLGFCSEFTLYPAHGRAIVILSNHATGKLIHDAIVKKILELWFGQPLKAQAYLDSCLQAIAQSEVHIKKALFPLTPAFMDRCLGSHWHEEIGAVMLGKDEGTYWIRFADAQRYELVGYEAAPGQQKIMVGNGGLLGVILEPVFANGVTLRLARGQEQYDFCRRS